MEEGTVSMDELIEMSFLDLLTLADRLEVVDNGLEDREDLIQRIILTYNKRQRNSHNPFEKFVEVLKDVNAKCDSLEDILKTLYNIFSKIPSGPLSEVLLKANLLKSPDLLLELEARKRALEDRDPLIIIAGETNGGKSSFLNVILGKKILPTDVLHCTIAICKIKYSKTYSIETLDNNDETQYFPLDGWEEANEKLKVLVAQEDMKTRLKGSAYKEITLRMPSPILESGITLVDTPGIGETEQMDGVTMNYIRSTRASAFIYVIKSDAAGGVQEDRLISFLRAIQEEYKNDSVEGAIDPRAALFICNRWDAISEEGVEKVKKNALTRLDIVWPGFQNEQVCFFSSKKTQLHLDADPEFVSDKLNDLMLTLKNLFTRASHINIQHQYRWAKYFLQPASNHLSSMINHCICSNEELEALFRTVVAKQETLMKDSKDNTPHLQETLLIYKEKLKEEVVQILSNLQPTNMEDFLQLVSLCSDEKFLQDSTNRQTADQWFVASIIHYCDKEMQESGILSNMENDTRSKIKEHMGLFEEQIKEIAVLVKGNSENEEEYQSRSSLSSSGRSLSSLSHLPVTTFDEEGERFMDLSQLDQAVGNFLGKKKKSSGLLKSLPKIKSKIVSTIRSGALSSSAGKDYKNPFAYVKYCISKNANLMKENEDIIEGFAVGYLRIVEMYIKSAVKKIPHFIEVNNKLMENIRDHRKAFQDDKCKMRKVMEELEPCRELLRGYGLLYMEDVNADLVAFNSKKTNSVIIPPKMGLSARPRDSGFIGSGSTWGRVRGFWVHLRNAEITIDDEALDVTIKTYTCPLDKDHQLREIASLRCLEHANLAVFSGMTRIVINTGSVSDSRMDDNNEKVSAFIFKGTLVAARMFKNNKLILKRDFVKNFLHGLLSGLDFIHRENMVHLELNLDTVMVNSETGIVQLCQQCIPREVELPANLSIATQASVCLSPSVLQGHKYDICDDIYAFGLLLWELVFPDNLPYAEQRLWPLERFIAEVFPNKMLSPEISKLQATDAVIKVLEGCLLSGKGRICIAMAEIKSFMSELNKDPILNSFQNHPRQYAIRMEMHPIPPKIKEDDLFEAPLRPPRKKDAERVMRNKFQTLPSKNQLRSQSTSDLSLSYRSTNSLLNTPQPNRGASNAKNGTSSSGNHQRKISLPFINVSGADDEFKNRYQRRKLSVPNIMITAPDQKDSKDKRRSFPRQANSLTEMDESEENIESKLEQMLEEMYRPQLTKQPHVKEQEFSSSKGSYMTNTTDDSNNPAQKTPEKKRKKGVYAQLRNILIKPKSERGSPALIRKKKLSSDMSSTSEESTEDNFSDHSVDGEKRRSWHAEELSLIEKQGSQKGNTVTTPNLLDSADVLRAFPLNTVPQNSNVNFDHNRLQETAKSSSSGDSNSSFGLSSCNSDRGISSACSSFRSYSSNVSDCEEINVSQRSTKQRISNPDLDLSSRGESFSPNRLDDFAGLSALPSLNRNDKPTRVEDIHTSNALPLFSIGGEMSESTSTLCEEMPPFDIDGLNFMSGNSQIGRSMVLDEESFDFTT